jgi:hypothetical protein
MLELGEILTANPSRPRPEKPLTNQNTIHQQSTGLWTYFDRLGQWQNMQPPATNLFLTLHPSRTFQNHQLCDGQAPREYPALDRVLYKAIE